jgi:hypothetical protein
MTAGGVLFSDDFTRLADPGPLSPWVVLSGNWAVTGGALTGGTNPIQSHGYAYIANSWTNYSVEGRIRFSSPNAWGGGIGGRLNPATGGRYAAWVYPEGSLGGSNVLRLIKFQTWTDFGYNGSSGVAMAEASLMATGTNWHTVKLAFHGDQIAVFYDGNQMISATDVEAVPYSSGGISADLWTALEECTMSVDDVIVRPLVVDDSYRVMEDTALIVADPGVWGNDTGVYATNLVAVLVSRPTYGRLNLGTNGGFTYSPAANYSGSDSFRYQANQGSNNLGVATVTITVAVPDVPLIIYTPASRTNNAGTAAVFSAVALGTLPLSYQWFWNGTNGLSDGGKVSGARSATLTISNTLSGDAGSYTVVVTNALGSATSAPPAMLIVIDPIITNPPASRTNNAGTTAMFSTGVLGTLPLSYEWFWNGTNGLSDGGNVSGARSANLEISNALGGDAGSYTVVVTNGLGGVISAPPAMLTVIDPVITSQPANQTTAAGTAALFSVEAFGTSPSYQWFKGGVAISGATNAALTLAVVSERDAASYNVVVSNAYGSVTSRMAELVFVPEPTIASVRFTNGIAVITWISVPGQLYRLQYKDGLSGTNWHDAMPDITAAGLTTTVTNALGGTTQRFYRVILTPPAAPSFAITSVCVAGGSALITWNSVGGQKYRLQYKNTLRETNWHDALPDVTAAGPTTTMTNALGSAPQRFYRVMLAPTVVPPFVITSIRLTNSVAVITWNSVAGQTYRLQYKDRLTDTTWQDVQPDVLATGPTTTLTNSLGSATQRFYRVTLVQAGVGRPLIKSISRSSGVVTIIWSSVLNQVYRLQYKDSLNDTNWIDVVPDVTATGPTAAMTDAASNPAQRFYRVILVP